MTTGRASIRLIRYRPFLFLGTILFRGLDDLMPFFEGLIRKGFFDALTGESGVGFNAWTFVVFFIVAHLADRGVLIFFSIRMGALALRRFNTSSKKPDDSHHGHVRTA